MSNIVIGGGPGLAVLAFNQISSANQLQGEIENSNSSQAQGAAKKKGTGAININSASNASLQKQAVNNQASSLLATYTSNICDFNILPGRTATATATGTWQATGSQQAQTQVPVTAIQQNLGVNVSSSIPTVTTPPTSYPDPTNPFRVSISGGDALPFSGQESVSQAASSRGGNALSTGSQSVQGTIERDHSIGMDGRVALTDQNGDPVNPNDPASAPGYDPVTNTAPGQSSFVLFSGSVTAPSLFIPGPVPGDPNPVVPGPTNNNLAGQMQTNTSVTNALQSAKKTGQGQTNNKINISKPGSFSNGLTSLMTITL
ncbi:MAG: hypothetical protein SFU25_07740 [Candidatus Caenarcaniphilales bacterium]|nr:hypothetical protein [Candidatus Caenarcaniphilales bacterium]